MVVVMIAFRLVVKIHFILATAAGNDFSLESDFRRSLKLISKQFLKLG